MHSQHVRRTVWHSGFEHEKAAAALAAEIRALKKTQSQSSTMKKEHNDTLRKLKEDYEDLTGEPYDDA